MQVSVPGKGTGEPCGSPHRRPNWVAVLTGAKMAACWRPVRLDSGTPIPAGNVCQRHHSARVNWIMPSTRLENVCGTSAAHL